MEIYPSELKLPTDFPKEVLPLLLFTPTGKKLLETAILALKIKFIISYSYSIVCPHVRGDNPRALE